MNRFLLPLIRPMLFLLLFNAQAKANSNAAADYNQENWQQWQQAYEKSVSGKGGWLSLAGLYWLTEGKNTLGSSEVNQHQLPNGTPKQLGYIQVDGDKVKFVSYDTNTRINNKVIKQASLSASIPTSVTFSEYEFYLIKREIGYAVRLVNHDSDKLKHFSGTKFIAYNQDWVIPAKLVIHSKPEIIKIPTVYGTTRHDKSAGWLEFEIDGKKQRLQAVDYGKENLLYVMFSDATSGDITYGAGRYIEVAWPDKNGDTLIDFNRAYNPPCAFTDYATCPLTPRQNRLNVLINAGELDVKK